MEVDAPPNQTKERARSPKESTTSGLSLMSWDDEGKDMLLDQMIKDNDP